MLRKFLCVALLATLAVPAQAGVLSSILTMDGNNDVLAADSQAYYVDVDNNGFTVGDVVFGWLQVNSVNSGESLVNPPSLIGIFSLTLAATNANNGPNATFGVAATTATGFTLEALAPNLTGASGASSADLGNSLYVLGGSGTEFDAGLDVTGVGADDEAKSVDHVQQLDAQGFSFEALIGLDSAANDFMDVQLLSTLSGSEVIFEQGGFSIFESSLAPSTLFLPVASNLGTPHDLVMSSGTASAATGNSPFGFGGQNQFLLNAVPEPGSFAIFGALLIGGVARRRRQK